MDGAGGGSRWMVLVDGNSGRQTMGVVDGGGDQRSSNDKNIADCFYICS